MISPIWALSSKIARTICIHLHCRDNITIDIWEIEQLQRYQTIRLFLIFFKSPTLLFTWSKCTSEVLCHCVVFISEGMLESHIILCSLKIIQQPLTTVFVVLPTACPHFLDWISLIVSSTFLYSSRAKLLHLLYQCVFSWYAYLYFCSYFTLKKHQRTLLKGVFLRFSVCHSASFGDAFRGGGEGGRGWLSACHPLCIYVYIVYSSRFVRGILHRYVCMYVCMYVLYKRKERREVNIFKFVLKLWRKRAAKTRKSTLSNMRAPLSS